MADYKFTRKENEKEVFTLLYKDGDGLPLDVSVAAFTLMIKEKKDRDPIVTIVDASFDKTEGAQGIIKVAVSMATLPPGKEYFMGVKAVIGVNTIKETPDIILDIKQSTVT